MGENKSDMEEKTMLERAAHLVKIDVKNLSVIAFLAYAMGFFVWNIYLSTFFNVFEYNLIQARFISAGAFAFVFLGPFILLLEMVRILIKRKIKAIWEKRTKKQYENSWLQAMMQSTAWWLGASLTISFIFIYSISIFPQFPQFIGGGKPLKVSLIGSPTQMVYLENFNIPLASNGERDKVQTEAVCALYQNDNLTLVGVLGKSQSNEPEVGFMRILYLQNDLYAGMQTRGGDYSKEDNTCSLKTILTTRKYE